MDLNRMKQLSGQVDGDVAPPTSTVPPASDVPAAQTGKLEQLIVVLDPDTKTAADMKADDLIKVVSPQELVDLLKGCGANCNISLYQMSARSEAEQDANERLSTHSYVAQHENDAAGKTDIENEVASKEEWSNPVKESTEVEVGLVPAALKGKKEDCCEVPKELQMRIKGLVKEIDDCLAAHEINYKHHYMHNQLDDAGMNLKALEVLNSLKHLLLDGNVSQATTYYTSLMGPLQEHIPVAVRKFLQYGGKEARPLSSYFKEVKAKE